MTVGVNGIATGESRIVLSLESFKLLNPKVSRFTLGTGGEPELTFQEVSDCLAQMSLEAAAWGRLCYAKQREYSVVVLDYLRREVTKEVWTDKHGLPDYWLTLIDIAVWMSFHDVTLTNRIKAKAVKRKRWTKNNEKHLTKCLFLLDQLDFELRAAISHWNKQRSVQDI